MPFLPTHLGSPGQNPQGHKIVVVVAAAAAAVIFTIKHYLELSMLRDQNTGMTLIFWISIMFLTVQVIYCGYTEAV